MVFLEMCHSLINTYYIHYLTIDVPKCIMNYKKYYLNIKYRINHIITYYNILYVLLSKL